MDEVRQCAANLTAHSAAPRAKRYKLYDTHGLHLLITPNGSKLWRIDYRADGKRRTLSLGPYPQCP